MKTREIKQSARLAPYRRALDRVGAALRANKGGPSGAELLLELRKKLFGAEHIDAINKAAAARAREEITHQPDNG